MPTNGASGTGPAQVCWGTDPDTREGFRAPGPGTAGPEGALQERIETKSMTGRQDTGEEWPVERRKRKDFWARLLTAFNILSWVLLFFLLVVAGLAKPEFESFFDRFYHLDIRTWCDMRLVRYLMGLAMGGTAVSSAGLLLSLARARRREDHGRIPLLIMGMVSALGLGCILYYTR